MTIEDLDRCVFVVLVWPINAFVNLFNLNILSIYCFVIVFMQLRPMIILNCTQYINLRLNLLKQVD